MLHTPTSHIPARLRHLARSCATGLGAIALLAGPPFTLDQATAQEPTFHAEQTGWTELTPHLDLVAFYEGLTAASPEVRVREHGPSAEGRALLEVTIARPAVATPWEAHASGKPIVLINAQVHGDEPAGKEALMLFARDLSLGRLNHLLDDVIFVFSPQLNPDGAEAGEWGTRNNPKGLNVNRDYLRLETSETRAFISNIIAAWSPHVIIDAHELVGPPRIYDFYTSFPRDIYGPSLNHDLTRAELRPAVVAALEEAGFTHFPYHRVSRALIDDPSIGLSAGTYGARALSSYGGAQAAITMLFESMRPRDARQNLEHRVRRQHVAMIAVAEWAAANGEQVIATVGEERRALAELGLRYDVADSIAILRREVPTREEDYRVEFDGRVLEMRVPILDSTVVTMGRVRPVGYLIDAEHEEVARHLAVHGLQVHRLEQAAMVTAESFRIDSISRGAVYEGYIPRQMWTSTEPAQLTAPAGSFIVRADQPTARILFHLMEPEDDNSLAAMGWFATFERPGRTLPVHRLTALPSAPTEVVTRRDANGAPRWAPVTEQPAEITTGDLSAGGHAARLEREELTSHDEVTAFFRQLTAGSPEGWMTGIGRSRQGRAMHLVSFSRPTIRTPWEAHASGKPILFIGAQVHGDEPAGKEGLMHFARELTGGRLNHLLDEVVFLFVPQLNPDGAEAATWGTRANTAGFNLNRDYLRLDNPESRAVVEQVLVPWRPHVVVDAHELTGPPRVYDFYTWFPTNPHGPAAPVQLADEVLAPAVIEALEKNGYSHIIYHTTSGLNRLAEDPSLGIHAPVYGRTLNDYASAQGMATILFESLRERDARVNIADRAERQRVAMEALAREVAAEAPRVVAVSREGRQELAERGARWQPDDMIAPLREPIPSRTIEYQIAESVERGGTREFTGRTVTVETPLYDDARVTLARTRPVGYVIEPHRIDLVRQLLDHGVQVEMAAEGTGWEVESFRIDTVELDEAVYEGYIPQRLRTTPERRRVELPRGSFLVRAGQPGAALVFHLMEPEDENSFAITGEFLSEARPGRTLPVHRVVEIPPVPMKRLGTEFGRDRL